MGSILAVKHTGLGKLGRDVRRGVKRIHRKAKATQREHERIHRQEIARRDKLSKGSDKSVAKHPYIHKPSEKSSIDKKRLHSGGYKIQDVKSSKGKSPRYNKWGDRIS